MKKIIIIFFIIAILTLPAFAKLVPLEGKIDAETIIYDSDGSYYGEIFEVKNDYVFSNGEVGEAFHVEIKDGAKKINIWFPGHFIRDKKFIKVSDEKIKEDQTNYTLPIVIVTAILLFLSIGIMKIIDKIRS